jgi:hypothetical protein
LTEYETGFKAGMKCGYEEIDLTLIAQFEAQGADAEAEEIRNDDKSVDYDSILAGIYVSEERASNTFELIPNSALKGVVIRPEPTDPKRCSYDDGFIDGLCCVIYANADVLCADEDDEPALERGWHNAMNRAVERAGITALTTTGNITTITTYGPGQYRLVKVSP